MNYILISGKRNSGKNYIGEMIAKGISKNKCHLCGFADIPKRMINFQEDSREEKEQNRINLIRFAEGEKLKDKYVWAAALYKETKDLDVNFIIVTDWRFKDEYDYIKSKANVITIRVEDNKYRGNYVDRHRSETELDDFVFDFYVNNTR